jgi:hypothetical protein
LKNTCASVKSFGANGEASSEPSSVVQGWIVQRIFIAKVVALRHFCFKTAIYVWDNENDNNNENNVNK